MHDTLETYRSNIGRGSDCTQKQSSCHQLVAFGCSRKTRAGASARARPAWHAQLTPDSIYRPQRAQGRHAALLIGVFSNSRSGSDRQAMLHEHSPTNRRRPHAGHAPRAPVHKKPGPPIPTAAWTGPLQHSPDCTIAHNSQHFPPASQHIGSQTSASLILTWDPHQRRTCAAFAQKPQLLRIKAGDAVCMHSGTPHRGEHQHGTAISNRSTRVPSQEDPTK